MPSSPPMGAVRPLTQLGGGLRAPVCPDPSPLDHGPRQDRCGPTVHPTVPACGVSEVGKAPEVTQPNRCPTSRPQTPRYFEALLQLKDQLRRTGAEFLSWTDIQDSVHATNAAVRDENDRLLAVQRINAALLQPDPQRTLAALLLPAAALPHAVLPNARRYHRVLGRARAAKAQATGDEGAELWWEEIERGVRVANEETAAARSSECGGCAGRKGLLAASPPSPPISACPGP
ncbi:ras GTPase-activating-like protein IQGAP3 [Numida meleagris]|uniref:ras GTPase-activating-like protein IQGAP3 n=1 Tax=Numida meleagris TaxID=8996 RepID=UPI000B3DF957|nr:ras GTPase-activating-like protein IQGAP3 [Numida meleagris]